MKAGIRTLMDVVPLDDTLVRGSHGRTSPAPGFEALIIADGVTNDQSISSTDVKDLILTKVFG